MLFLVSNDSGSFTSSIDSISGFRIHTYRSMVSLRVKGVACHDEIPSKITVNKVTLPVW